jgi:hypothetical protein
MRLNRARGIKTFERPDGRARLFIFVRDDGLYEYRAEAEDGNGGHACWTETDISGLFDTAARAEADAAASVCWLRIMIKTSESG